MGSRRMYHFEVNCHSVSTGPLADHRTDGKGQYDMTLGLNYSITKTAYRLCMYQIIFIQSMYLHINLWCASFDFTLPSIFIFHFNWIIFIYELIGQAILPIIADACWSPYKKGVEYGFMSYSRFLDLEHHYRSDRAAIPAPRGNGLNDIS